MTKNRSIARVIASCSFAVAVSLALGGCVAVAQMATAERQPLSYVGDVSLGTPVIAGRRVTVPVSFSGGEWLRNSAIIPYRIDSQIVDQEIAMTVITAIAGNGSPAPAAIVLKGVSPGVYPVFYRDPDGSRHQLSQIVKVE